MTSRWRDPAYDQGHLLHWPAVNTGLYNPGDPRYAAHQAKLRSFSDPRPIPGTGRACPTSRER
jgi:hypothetical protein